MSANRAGRLFEMTWSRGPRPPPQPADPARPDSSPDRTKGPRHMSAPTVRDDHDTATMPDDIEPVQEWIFTFGLGHRLRALRANGRPDGEGFPLDHSYVVIIGTRDSTRNEMFRLFGTAWSHQYGTPTEAGVYEYGLVRLAWQETDDGR